MAQYHFPADHDGHSPPTSSTTVVAIDKDKNSPYALRWAIDHILPANNTTLLLIHVNRNFQQHRFASISGVNDTALDGNGGPTDADPQQVFSTFRVYCARRGVSAKEVVVDDTDVAKALLNYISSNFIANIALGASTRSALARKLKNNDVITILNKYAPDFCSVYVIAKEKALSVRPAVRPAVNSATPPRLPSPREIPSLSLHDLSELEDGPRAQSMRGGRERVRTKNSPTNLSMDMDVLTGGAKKSSSRNSVADDSDFQSTNLSMDIEVLTRGSKKSSSCNLVADDTDFSAPRNTGSFDITPQNLDFANVAESLQDSSSPSSSKDVEAKMKKLKLELKQTINMYNTACKEAESATKKAKELNTWKKEEARKFEQALLAEEAALAIVEKEKAKSRAAVEAAEKAKKLAEMEAQMRKYAELKVKREVEEKNRALDVLSHNDVRYRKYTIEEIEAATDRFSSSLKIGEGGYGPVYKGKLDHTPVAIKVLRPDAKQGRMQFQQEVEILSRIRHPNMVLLLGACPEYGCLVYEFMNYGSLEDRLFRKGNTPPLPWRTRFKIAADIATGLLFLHQAKPEPLVHRDLKPANILLDRNFVCKISDVGLARLVPPSVADSVTQYHMTSAAGTFCYIDPEYQQTGELGTKSDIYSLGVMLLQIITARPPMGLTHHVGRAIQKGMFADLLDPTVPDWPVEDAFQFANLALKCCELRKKDRPDLGLIILPELNRLRELGKNTKSSDHRHRHRSQKSISDEGSSNGGQEAKKKNSADAKGNADVKGKEEPTLEEDQKLKELENQ